MTTTTPVIEKHEARLQTGVRLRYADVGPRSGEPLILLHGFSESSLHFHPVLGLLPPDVRLIIHGPARTRSVGAPAPGVYVERVAMDAIALFHELGISSATVVGHSLGSFVARWMAVLAPDRVRRLVLVGSAATSCNNTLVDLAGAISSLSDPVEVAFVREFQASCVYRWVPEAVIDEAVRQSMKLPARVWKSVIEGLIEPPFAAQSGAIRCPVFVFWGDQDSVFNRADQDHLLRQYPGSSSACVPRCRSHTALGSSA